MGSKVAEVAKALGDLLEGERAGFSRDHLCLVLGLLPFARAAEEEPHGLVPF
jgi:hypothetical protein